MPSKKRSKKTAKLSKVKRTPEVTDDLFDAAKMLFGPPPGCVRVTFTREHAEIYANLLLAKAQEVGTKRLDAEKNARFVGNDALITEAFSMLAKAKEAEMEVLKDMIRELLTVAGTGEDEQVFEGDTL